MFRNTRQTWRWFVIAAAIGLLCCVQASAKKPPAPEPEPEDPVPSYSITPFMPPGVVDADSFVMDINDQGEAVGVVRFEDGTDCPVYYDIVSGEYVILKGGSGVNIFYQASSINSHGQIVGTDYGDAVFWESFEDAEQTQLPPLPGDAGTRGDRINDAGVVLGASFSAEGSQRAVVWRITAFEGLVQVEGPVPLLPPGSDQPHLAQAMNEVVEGEMQIAGHLDGRAVIWTMAIGEGTGELSVTSVSPVGVDESVDSKCLGINNWGEVCGKAAQLPFTASPAGDVEFLPVPRKTSTGFAWDINDDGDAVGYVVLLERGVFPVDYAQLWSGGEQIDLTSLLPRGSDWDRLSQLHVINNYGVLGGVGSRDGRSVGFVMMPSAP
jgi:uncharacterized membrane protein